MNKISRRRLLLTAIPSTFILLQASAQEFNKDSASLVEKIASDKEKLTQLQAQLPEKEKLKTQTAEQAQRSADDNRKAANKLSNDPSDRKLARRAENNASDARDDAKKARSAETDYNDLLKDIRKTTERIEKQQKKLDKYVKAGEASRTANPV